MIQKTPILLITMIVLALAASHNVAFASNQLAFPGEVPKKSALNAQKKAETAYAEGDFRSAYWYYRKELAPIGDKYAQYMVGYMLENGEGVQKDPKAAAAWYMLAAERGHEKIVAVSTAYQRELSPEQLKSVRRDAVLLQTEIGDRALVERLIRRDQDRLNNITGSRLAAGRGGCGRITRVYSPNDVGGSMSVERFCKTLNARIEKRMAYIGGYVEFGELELLPDEALEESRKEK
ncbi:MAG: hypothetical protein AB8F65_10395 [Woeseiaceae bacterium]